MEWEEVVVAMSSGVVAVPFATGLSHWITRLIRYKKIKNTDIKKGVFTYIAMPKDDLEVPQIDIIKTKKANDILLHVIKCLFNSQNYWDSWMTSNIDIGIYKQGIDNLGNFGDKHYKFLRFGDINKTYFERQNSPELSITNDYGVSLSCKVLIDNNRLVGIRLKIYENTK